MGWSRGKVRNYVFLENISPNVWKIIGTEFQKIVPQEEAASVPWNGTTVPISETLLRSITCLQPDHQHDLVSDLINGEITKAKFKSLAAAYKARDEAALYVWERLNRIDQELWGTVEY